MGAIGSIMKNGYLSYDIDMTAGHALENVRVQARDGNEFYIFAVDGEHRLRGMLAIQDLIAADENAALWSIMSTQILVAGPEESISTVAHALWQIQASAVPIIDGEQKLSGVVTMEDVRDILLLEEDGVSESMYDTAKYWRVLKPLYNLDVLRDRIENIKRLAEPKSADKKFLVIQTFNSGLFSIVTISFTYVMYAVARGMIPIIDMQSYPNSYLDEYNIGRENAWEYYFKQPCGYGLGDVDKEACIFDGFGPFPDLLSAGIFDKENYLKNFDVWAALFQSFFALRDEVERHVEEEYKKIIKPGMRVIGVHCRGTDYTSKKPYGHAVQPAVADVVEKVGSVMQAWGCDYIYVMSDEGSSVKMFEEAFPGKVLTLPCMYFDEVAVDYSRVNVADAGFNRDNDRYLKGLEYVTQVMVLSRCTSLVTGVNNGSMAAMYINGGRYENSFVFDLGVYE